MVNPCHQGDDEFCSVAFKMLLAEGFSFTGYPALQILRKHVADFTLAANLKAIMLPSIHRGRESGQKAKGRPYSACLLSGPGAPDWGSGYSAA
jgi:hypothetical protein